MSDFDVFEAAQKAEKANQAAKSESEAAKRAVLGALSPLRTIAKVLSASLSTTTLTDPETTERQSQALIEHIGQQTLALHEKLGSVEDYRILPSLTGSITTALAELYRTNGQEAFKVDMASVLAKVADTDGIWAESKERSDAGSLSYRRTMSMMHAMAPVMAAAQRFDYYYSPDTLPVEDIQSALWETVDRSLTQHPIAEVLEEPEIEMLRRNTLLRAGELMAAAWDTQAPIARAQVNEASADERRAFRTNGYPLDSVFDQFDNAYTLLERSMDAALRSHFQNALAELNDQPDPHAPR